MIVVVSGLPRSGTSLVMQMLRAGGLAVLADEARPADADNPRGYLEDRRVKNLDRDAAWLREAEGRALKVVSPLLKYLPQAYEYKIIFVERNLDEVIRSQQFMLTRRNQTGARVSPEKLASVFARHLEETRKWLLERREMQVLFVNYKDLVSDPRGLAQRIQAYLGIPLDVDAMASVVDPTLYRQRATNG